MSPKVTVGIPVYNGERFIAEALHSVQNQDFGDIEILVADNASTDGTEDITQAACLADSRIKYLRSDRNRGGAWNMNRLYQQASAPLFKWAFYDDVLDPRLLTKCVDALDSAGPSAVIAHTRVRLIDESGNTVGERADDDLRLEQPEPHRRLYELFSRMAEQALFGVIRTDALKRTRGVQPTVSDGFVLLNELCLQGRFVPVPERLLAIREHPGQHGGDRASEVRWFREATGGRPVFPYTRVNAHLYTSVWRSTLPVGEKLACSSAVFRGWTLKKWRSYASDVRHLRSDLRGTPTAK
jgi:glycosyltransferase involved in cell wall biosynthesis